MAPISKVSNLFIKILLVALIASLLLHPSLVDATDLRGRVEGKHAYSSNVFAASNVSVALYIQTGSGWKHMAATNTGPDGTYFIPNVRPGNYFLQVGGRMNFPLQVQQRSLQDIPPILLPY